MVSTFLTESMFRSMAAQVYQRIERAFEGVDPDVVECEHSQGAMMFTLENGAKWVLSMQPPVRQMWLAVASRGRAHHFNYHSPTQKWIDDKDSNLELLAYLGRLVQEEAHINLAF